MRIKGINNNVFEFYNRMTDYEKPNHLYRMFSADICEEHKGENGITSIDVSGDCAWSIESCCRTGYTGGVDLLKVNSEELGLEIEIWSEESGMCFQEHYLYKHGQCLIDSCVDWQEIYYDKYEYETFEEFREDWKLPSDVTEKDLLDGCYYVGGFDNYCEFCI